MAFSSGYSPHDPFVRLTLDLNLKSNHVYPNSLTGPESRAYSPHDRPVTCLGEEFGPQDSGQVKLQGRRVSLGNLPDSQIPESVKETLEECKNDGQVKPLTLNITKMSIFEIRKLNMGDFEELKFVEDLGTQRKRSLSAMIELINTLDKGRLKKLSFEEIEFQDDQGESYVPEQALKRFQQAFPGKSIHVSYEEELSSTICDAGFLSLGQYL